MKKTAVVVIFLFSIKATCVYGQHRVNDIKNENGWYKISIESDANGHSRYTVTQCYPNGDEYLLSDNERKAAPLWVKVICIALFEEVLEGTMDNLSFAAEGIYVRMMGFILMIDSSKSDEEVLESFEPEQVAKYKDRDW
ncbi:MAG: hypothetical protein LBG27_12105 [Spirochaetaceae bacterium]|jgi:hypothetical protein|nr:hypothetical protein [Spirochaetaceae bacterium]